MVLSMGHGCRLCKIREDVTLHFKSTRESEGVVLQPVTFSPSSWQTAATVFVRGVADGIADGDQAYAIHLDSVDSLDPLYRAVTMPDIAAINYDSSLHFLD